MKRVQDLPSKKPSFETDHLRDVRRYVKKKLERQYTLMACSKKDEGGIYFLCTHHESHIISKCITINRKDSYGNLKKCSIKHSFLVPTGVGMKAAALPLRQENKGLGYHSEYNRLLKDMKKEMILATTKATNHNK